MNVRKIAQACMLVLYGQLQAQTLPASSTLSFPPTLGLRADTGYPIALP